MVLALILFIIMYVFFLMPKTQEYRWLTALIFAAIFVLLGIMPLNKVMSSVNWNIILMLAGTMIVVELFIESKMPMRMAERLLHKLPSVQWAIVALAMFAGVVSAFVDNVAASINGGTNRPCRRKEARYQSGSDHHFHCCFQQPAGCSYLGR